jgi:hypothetical protein
VNGVGLCKAIARGTRVQEKCAENRGLLHNGNNTRSSPHPSVVTLGCLDERDKRGEGQGCYSRQLGQRLGMDTMLRVELLRVTMPQLASATMAALSKEEGDNGEKATAWIGDSSQA